MRKRILASIICASLAFGTVFVNAVSISFDDIDNETLELQETNETSITFEELEHEEIILEENNINDELSPLATETNTILKPESIELEPVQTYDLRASIPFDITVSANTDGYASVSLDWSGYDYYDKNFKVYKSADGGVTYEIVGIDYTLVDEVKCLQIYPISDASNQLKTWMQSNGYGKGIIKIDSVHIDSFNANPDAYLKDSNGNYKYDVIFFGTWDSNGNKDLTSTSVNSVIQYIKSGRGCILGHDTFSYNPVANVFGNFYYPGSYFGLTIHNLYGNPSPNNNVSNNVKIIHKGLFTNYPWYIGEIGTVLTIPTTHNVGQRIDKAAKWLEFCNISAGCATALSIDNYYLATYNNCAQIMTGHSNGVATADEQKF